jgi:DNA-binding response OmpR family regulator
MNEILIVDDNSENLKLLADLLKMEKYNIRVVKDGSNAITTIKKKHPDLVLLDIMMPGLNGYEVCRQIKKLNQNIEIPIIFITALTENENKALAYQSGGVDYITKPIQTEEVLTCIKTHLELGKLKSENNQPVTTGKYKKVNLPEYKRKEYAKRLNNYMLNEQVFLNDEISIPRIAALLKIPRHHLSMTINIEFNQNFYSYINTFRIKYAEQILKNPKDKDKSILMIAYRSGFQTKSAFNRAFKDHNGVTPTEFRKVYR